MYSQAWWILPYLVDSTEFVAILETLSIDSLC